MSSVWKNLWKDLKKDSNFNVYFHDEYPNDKGPNREYFFNILNTIYWEYLEQIIAHASKERFTAAGQANQEKTIIATDEWYQALHNMPYKSRK